MSWLWLVVIGGTTIDGVKDSLAGLDYLISLVSDFVVVL